MKRPGSLLILAMVAGCGSAALPPGDAAPEVVRCPLATEVIFGWTGRLVYHDTYRLVPPARLERMREGSGTCSRQVPDCENAKAVDLGELAQALANPALEASWPGSGERIFRWDPGLTDFPAFYLEMAGRGRIYLSSGCEPTGCDAPIWLFDLKHTMAGLADESEASCR